VYYMDTWYLNNLVCPREHLKLNQTGDALICPRDHRYPVVDGIPVMLLDDVRQTMGIIDASLKRARGEIVSDERAPYFYLESLGISEKEKDGIIELSLQNKSNIDPVVTYLIGATNGIMYKHLIGKLDSYPIPDLCLPEGNGQALLDIGCSWGRWCIAAQRKGYVVVGIDPSLGAIMAARRVSQQLGLSIKYLVADARYLPFDNNSFNNIFSYSVLQHLDRDNVRMVLSEIARILKPQGTSLIQMPNIFGLRCLYHQAKRNFRKAVEFEVRYRSLSSLRKLFSESIGKTEISVDCYFGLGLQKSDARFMSLTRNFILTASELLKKISKFIPFIIHIADSVYLRSTCEK